MAIKVPIIERVAVNIENRVRSITNLNDYAFNVSNVIRTKELPGVVYPSGTVMISERKEHPNDDYRSTHHLAFVLPVTFYIFGGLSDNPHSEWNYIKADFRTAFGEFIFDEFHPQPCQAMIYVDYINGAPWHAPTGSQMITGGWLNYNFTFRNLINSEYQWDRMDRVLTQDQLNALSDD